MNLSFQTIEIIIFYQGKHTFLLLTDLVLMDQNSGEGRYEEVKCSEVSILKLVEYSHLTLF